MSRALAMLGLCAVVGGCGAARSPAVESMPPPASPGEAREQMARLEAMIRDGRVALGLPARAAMVDEDAVQAGAGAAEAEPPPAPAAARHAPAAPSMPSPAPAEAADDAVSYRAEAPTCAPGCRHTKAICHAAERICSLADYLGEPDARRRCSRARRDCSDARQATAGRDCGGCD